MPQPGSQEFIRATVHLAGKVEIETGHATRYSAEHVQTRIGSALVYLLDYVAAANFGRAAQLAAQRGDGLFAPGYAATLPGELLHSGQDSSVIVRMRGAQTSAAAQAISASASRHRRPYLACQVGGLVLVLHDGEAVARLVQVAETAHRVARALWPISTALTAKTERDLFAEQWGRARTHR